jgi:hypothetical protein
VDNDCDGDKDEQPETLCATGTKCGGAVKCVECLADGDCQGKPVPSCMVNYCDLSKHACAQRDTCGDGLKCNASTSQCECNPKCAAGKACNLTTGVCDCVPQCDGNVCGSDGCRGFCPPNNCGTGKSCSAGQCVTACGNKQVEPGEACDDGNGDNSDDCVMCQFARCGDGYLRWGKEDCDSADPTWAGLCSSSCTRLLYNSCTDSTLSAQQCPMRPAACLGVTPELFCASAPPDGQECPKLPGFTSKSMGGTFCGVVCNGGKCPSKMTCAFANPTAGFDVCVPSAAQ